MRLVLLSGWLAMAAGCGSQTATEDTVDAGNVVQNDAGRTGRDITVTYADGGVVVSLAGPTPMDVAGQPMVRLLDVVVLAFPQLSGRDVGLGFLASDGFNPASRPNCAALLPVRGTAASQGYIDPLTRNLSWDPALQYPGCLNVRDAAEINVTAP